MSITTHSLEDLEIPEAYYFLSLPKLELSKAVKEEMKQQGFSSKSLAKVAGIKKKKVAAVLRGENYKIDTLLKVLNALEMEILFQRKDVS